MTRHRNSAYKVSGPNPRLSKSAANSIPSHKTVYVQEEHLARRPSPEVCLVQVAPPLLVRRMVPNAPTAYPVEFV